MCLHHVNSGGGHNGYIRQSVYCTGCPCKSCAYVCSCKTMLTVVVVLMITLVSLGHIDIYWPFEKINKDLSNSGNIGMHSLAVVIILYPRVVFNICPGYSLVCIPAL